MSSYRQQSNKFFKIALIVSLIIHIAILFWKFVVPQVVKLAQDYDLKIVLVNGKTSERPSGKADVLAQVDVSGGGDQADGMKMSPLPNTGKEADGQSLVDSTASAETEKTAEELAQENRRLLQQKKQALETLIKANQEHHDAPTAEQNKEELRKIETALAVIDEKMNNASKSPRRIFYVPAAKRIDEAMYVKSVEARFISESNRHYPAEIQGIYGKVSLVVELNKDGTVLSTQVVDSSGKPTLDQAAQRLVKMAQPYGEFPPELAKRGTIFQFVSVYTFANGQVSEVSSKAQVK